MVRRVRGVVCVGEQDQAFARRRIIERYAARCAARRIGDDAAHIAREQVSIAQREERRKGSGIEAADMKGGRHVRKSIGCGRTVAAHRGTGDPLLAARALRHKGQTYHFGTSPVSKLLSLVFALLALAAAPALAAPAYDADAVARIHAGIVDCPGCNLAGADLTNTCVKAKNLTGADFDGATAVLMCMSYANFSSATFRGTDLSAANLAHATVDGADFSGAVMDITSIKGTDLTHAKGLTQKQLDQACGDADTRAPAGLKVHTCT
jgi:hypothetical protein